MTKNDRCILIILDGWGIGKHDKSDAIFNAITPFINGLYSTVPNTTLTTFGNAVGLPEGQMGNSEVGHLNIGSGRVVWQQLALINKAFEEGSVASRPALKEALEYAKVNNKKLHLMGLVSNGGVHSSIEHLKGLCTIAEAAGISDTHIHAFLDGRDTDPKSGIHFIAEMQEFLKDKQAAISSVIGRYYAMDRDKRWERTKLAYDLLVNGQGQATDNIIEQIRQYYNEGITDEFMKPIVNTAHKAVIENGDVVICFNFRTDRGRQISQVLTQQDFPEYGMHKMNLHYLTMTEYDDTYKNVQVIFETHHTNMTLGEVIARQGLKQVRAAETEKYPHVTFFFSGGREEPFENEKRLLSPSPKVATYDLQPEMSAEPLTQSILNEIELNEADFMCINFANPDMVGHTGVYSAIVKAVEKVDDCARRIIEAGKAKGYQFVIIADHGNADEAINPDGTPNTAHSVNPVPCFIISDKCKSIKGPGVLADVAPTILKLMNIPQPAEMTGRSLC